MARVGVVIPTYNRPEFLEQALKSVLAQSRLPDELIVLDDNPESVKNGEIVGKYSREFPFIRYVKNEVRLGVVDNYRKAFKISSADYLKILSDDDILHPDALAVAERILDENPDCTVIGSPRIMVDDRLRFLNLFSFSTFGKLEGKMLIRESLERAENILGEFSSIIFRKEKVNIDCFEFDGFNIRANADWYLWMWLASRGKVFYYDKPLVLFRYTELNDQANLRVFLAGIQEKFFFVTNRDFHRHLGVDFPEQSQVKAVLRLLPEIERLKKGLTSFPYSGELKNSWQHLKYSFFSWLNKLPELTDSGSRPSVSVIIVTFNSESIITGCLSSLVSELKEGDEIIIVDNNSEDRTVELVKKFASGSPVSIKILEMDKNEGYSRAVNRGVQISKGEVLIFLNPDTLVTGGMVDRLVSALYKEDEIGVAGPLSVNVSYTQHVSAFVPIFEYFFSGKDFLDYKENVSRYLALLFQNKTFDTKLLIGMCIAVKKNIFKKIGELDENLFLGMDDFEFSWRLRENGYKLKIVPSAFVYHFGHLSFKTLPEEQEKSYQIQAVRQLWEKLIDYYGFGNVPTVKDLWDLDRKRFPVNLHHKKYNFMFRFSGVKKGQEWYLNGVKVLKDRPEIAVVIVSYFSSGDILHLLASLKNSSYPLKVFIVDNSESDEEFERLLDVTVKIFGVENVKQCCPGEEENGAVVLIKNKNTGFAGGINTGVRAAVRFGIPYVWILNPDTAVAEDTAFELLKTSIYTGVPVVTCEIRSMVDPAKVQYNGYRVDLNGLIDRAFFLKEVSHLSGSNIFCRSDVFKKVGFMKEDYFLYFEDDEFLDRLKAHGIWPLYTPYTFILHKGGSTTGGFLKTPVSLYYFIRNLLYYGTQVKKLSFRVLAYQIFEFYRKFSYSKDMLKSIIEAVRDYGLGVTGKKEFPISVFSEKDDDDIKILSSISLDFQIEELRRFLLNKSRKKEKFMELLRLVEIKRFVYDRT
ncbi:glycosyltransferase [Desulfurobacterium sp.]